MLLREPHTKYLIKIKPKNSLKRFLISLCEHKQASTRFPSGTYMVCQPYIWRMHDSEGSSVLRWGKAFIRLRRSSSLWVPFTEAGLCCCGESFWKSHHPWAALSVGWTWRQSSLGRWLRSIRCAGEAVGHIFGVVGAGAVTVHPRCWGPGREVLLPNRPGCNSAAAMEACGHAHNLQPLNAIVCGNQS